MSPNPAKLDAKHDSNGAVTRMELIISTLLRTGMLISLAVVTVGIVVMFAHHPEYRHSREILDHLKSAEYRFPTTIRAIASGVVHGEGRAIILLGVFVLFLTPLLRVAACVITFAHEKDWAFTVITSIVLTFVILSLVLGKAG